MFKRQNSFKHALAGFASSIVIAAVTPAMAQNGTSQSFAIEAQTLGGAINALSRQSGSVIIVPSELVAGKTARALSGAMTVQEALERLMEGTDLEVKRDSAGAFVVYRRAVDEELGYDLSLQEIVVTGSRIVRDGYEAPTPTTVLGIEDIQTAAPHNIADFANRVPAFAGSANPRTQRGQISNGGTGINTLNLRNLGVSRTLILLDGKRVPVATVSTGLTDINSLPGSIVKRIEVVTGGASAAWGSDAVAGVVNFVLDKEFTGIKGDVQGGITTHGDDENFKIDLSAGTSFANDRGHVLLSLSEAHSAGIEGLPRNWYKGDKIMYNPAYDGMNGEPQLLVVEGAGFTTVAPGAIVTSGPLRGLYFGEGGMPAQLNYGSIVNDPYMVGGDWEYTDFGKGVQDLDPMISRQKAFLYVNYDITDSTQVYGQFSYGRAHTSMDSTPQFNFGNITIQQDNAFLPAEIAQSMTDLGLETLTVGSWNADLGGILTKTTREQYRYLIGFMGEVELFGTNWSWDVSANRNKSKIFNSANVTITSRYKEAIDSVLDPNGVIVCRSTLTDPNNGCVPYNILGTGTVSEAAKNYVVGTSYMNSSLRQNIFSASIQGEPFSTWAGPVSFATGVEHRSEKLSGESDPLSQTKSYWAGNYAPISGSYNVTEGFLETIVPLANNESWAKALDINGAVRFTDYSTSGFVTTWKVGLNYRPIEDVRFRITRSRDIRAPNFSELFAAGQTQTFIIADPFNNNESTNYFQIRGGNAGLNPEKANTLNIGAVFQPTFLPNFSASIDYFDIKVKDAIITVGDSTLLQQCYLGDEVLCNQIVRDGNGLIKEIHVQPVNFAKQRAEGIDFEASYRLPLSEISASLGSGELTFRGMATRYLTAEVDNITTPVDSSLGESGYGTPKWRYLLTATYTDGPMSVSVTGRGYSDGVYNASYIACESGCPVSTSENRTINTNFVSGRFYLDASFSMELNENIEMYVVVDNLMDKGPAGYASGTGVGSAPIGASGIYDDLIGRMVRAGMRFQF